MGYCTHIPHFNVAVQRNSTRCINFSTSTLCGISIVEEKLAGIRDFIPSALADSLTPPDAHRRIQSSIIWQHAVTHREYSRIWLSWISVSLNFTSVEAWEMRKVWGSSQGLGQVLHSPNRHDKSTSCLNGPNRPTQITYYFDICCFFLLS